MPTPTYDLIASNVLSSSASSVTFSSIPATYRDLVLICTSAHTGLNSSQQLRGRLNGDTTNYSHVNMYAYSSFTVSETGTFFPIGFTYSTQGLSIVHFMDYSATNKHKTALLRTNGNGNADLVAAQAARWASTSAINSIEVFYVTDNIASGSTFYLYGIAS